MRGSVAPVAVAAAEGKSAEAPRLWNPGPPATPASPVKHGNETRARDIAGEQCQCHKQVVGIPESGNDRALIAPEVSTRGAGTWSVLTADRRDGVKLKARSCMAAITRGLVSKGRVGWSA
jgi:hypothetical protein